MSKSIFIFGIIVWINCFLPSILSQGDFLPVAPEMDVSEQATSNEITNDVESDNDWINLYEVPSTISKRDPGPTFWPTHPSDYAPMRRPPGKPLVRKMNNNKKSGGSSSSDPENPYHPVPRAVKQHQKNIVNKVETEDEEWENNRIQKRQSPGSYLLLKLSRKAKDTSSTGRKIRRRS